MASRLDTFQEFVLKFSSPWNLGAVTTKEWTQSMYVSGTITHTDAEAEAAALDLASVALAFASSATSLIGFSYYPSGSLIATTVKTYSPGTHPGSASVYVGGGGPKQQLEVSAVLHAPIGKNVKGKEIYLRKYCHDVVSSASDPNSLPGLAGISTVLAKWNTGSGPHNVVPVSPTSGHAGVWVAETHLFTHQLRKGKKKKKPVGAGALSIAEKVIQDALQAKGLASLAEELAAAL